VKTPDGQIEFLSPGGAYLPEERALVVADLHAGYVQTLQHRGYTLPSQGDEALYERLRAMFACVEVARLLVAGDLLHGRPALVRRGGQRAPLELLLDVLDGRALTVVAGNHDRGVRERLQRSGVEVTDCARVGPHVVLHGDEDIDRLRGERALALARGGALFVGHHHPALTLDDGAGTRGRVPVFAHAPGLLCLPALAPLARGACLLRAEYVEGITALAEARELSLFAVVGSEVIAVGTLARVRAVHRRRPSRAPSR